MRDDLMNRKKYIRLNDKTIPIEYTNRVKHLKLYNILDEFYIKCPKNYEFDMGLLYKSYSSWMDDILNRNQPLICSIKSKIDLEKPALLNRSKNELNELTQKYLDKFKYKGIPNNTSIRTDMDKSWATHSINHNITFNFDLSKIPSHLIEYIVFHELCHFQEFEHTPKFYELIKEKYPNFKEYDINLHMYNYLILHDKRKQLNLE